MPLLKASGVCVRRPTILSNFSSRLMNGRFTNCEGSSSESADASWEPHIPFATPERWQGVCGHCRRMTLVNESRVLLAPNAKDYNRALSAASDGGESAPVWILPCFLFLSVALHPCGDSAKRL